MPAEDEPAAAWGGTPVFVYGFDDFNGLQLEALELDTIANWCGPT